MTYIYGDGRLPERFWSKTQVVAEASTYPGPCWIWTGGANDKGYGRFYFNNREEPAHRTSYRELIAPYDTDLLEPDHLCRIRPCVNPGHIEIVTHRENTLRGETIVAAHAAKTHCIRGHEFTKENVYMNAGGRTCKTCRSQASAERRASPLAEEDSRHGTRTGYSYGCKCAECKAAQSSYNRSRYRPKPRIGPEHGRRARYLSGCRCDSCRQANSSYERDRKR